MRGRGAGGEGDSLVREALLPICDTTSDVGDGLITSSGAGQHTGGHIIITLTTQH